MARRGEREKEREASTFQVEQGRSKGSRRRVTGKSAVQCDSHRKSWSATCLKKRATHAARAQSAAETLARMTCSSALGSCSIASPRSPALFPQPRRQENSRLRLPRPPPPAPDAILPLPARAAWAWALRSGGSAWAATSLWCAQHVRSWAGRRTRMILVRFHECFRSTSCFIHPSLRG